MAQNLDTEKKSLDIEDFKVYEVGYFVVPLVAEADLSAEVGKIRSALEERAGVFISDEFPATRGLAYPMRKAIGERNHVFDTGYFGWIKFEMAAENVQALKEDLSGLGNILRFLLIETVRESVFFSPKSTMLGSKSSGTIEGVIENETRTISDEELDKSIEELIAE